MMEPPPHNVRDDGTIARNRSTSLNSHGVDLAEERESAPCKKETLSAMKNAEAAQDGASKARSLESTAGADLNNGGYGSAGISDPEKQDNEKYNSPPNSPHRKSESLKPPPRPPMSLAHEIAFITIVSSAQLLTQSGLGQVIAPLHIIARSFGAPTPGQLSWFAAAYSLTVGTFILIAGRLGDIFGHKKLFVIGYFWFGLWSLVAGLAVYSKSQIFFDFCRAMQGIGPAVLLPNSLAILGRTYPQGKRKDMVFSIFGATAPGGFVIGAAFSGLLAQRAWWPWAYWCMAIVCSLCAVCAIFVIPDTPEDTTLEQGSKSFDFLGSITGIAGLVLLNVAWNQAPIVGWNAPYIPVLLVLGLLFLLAFFLIERKVTNPLLPLQCLSGDVGFVLGCIALGWSSFGIWVFYLWQFIEELRHVSPVLGAAQLVPSAISGLCAAITTGFLLSRVRTAYIMVIAMMAFCLGNILLATMPIEQTYWAQQFVSTVVVCWGMDMSFPAATIILSDLVPRRNQGIAASLVNTIVNYSISIGLGIAGTVEVHVNRGGTDMLRGYRGAWYAGIGTSGMGVLLSLYFVFHGLRRE
ncbi:Low affinity NH4+ transporter [Lignoscripta atroalba]|nr:Low affinity NH4+ transporter [Lignoscripta atroalba]